MRLLEHNNAGQLSLTKDLIGDDIPKYAILSHTWGVEEVTFRDLVDGTGKSKEGYNKIRFCAQQAANDDLRFFWVDTCCINKSNMAELQDAISSMFRWYQRSTKCYVYLSDVSVRKRTREDESRPLWEQAFRNSRWFTRGWTLQELLAPASVLFFSKEGSQLGDKQCLLRQLHEITGIPETALRGERLSQFTVKVRMSWTELRQTTRTEDLAYSLLGIFGVDLPLRYGEGKVAAFERLEKEIDRLEKCIQDLRLIDPSDHKQHIELKRGGLLEDSYHWIFEHSDFQTWRNDEQNRLLWIKGDPGKGKTMLLCGIINELNRSIEKTALLCYFFCEATNSRVNNATAVLRGLIFMLVRQQPSLVSHIRKKYDQAGKALFEDSNAWFALSDTFTDMLEDHHLSSTYLIIDALDECVTADLPRLLEFVVKKSSLSPRVKWVVSSRNGASIEGRLNKAGSQVRLCLELNAESISAAVNIYIKHKVRELAQEKKYNDKTRDAVFNYLSSNANDTFLWVALVCQNLENIPRGRIHARLKSFPPGLDSLYERMMKQICESEDSELCKQILATVATVYRPITLTELTLLVEMLEDMSDDTELLPEIIGLCGSLLTIQDYRIYFVHQSAKEYLLNKASAEIFPSGREKTHYEIFKRSLEIMSRTLRRDIYGLGTLGCLIEEVKQPDPDPLMKSRYSCVYWIDHLCDWNLECHTDHRDDLKDGGSLGVFMREKFLHWLEALSLCKSMSNGVLSMGKLKAFMRGRLDASTLAELVEDARRFILYNRRAIEISPLQAYSSALIFSPSGSLIRRQFREEEPQWIEIKPMVGDKWSACLQTLEGHTHHVNSVAFSSDGEELASASADGTVKIWDIGSGKCIQTLMDHSSEVSSVAFSPNSEQLASASYDSTIKIWDTSSGKCVQTFKVHKPYIKSIAFSPDETRLVSLQNDNTVRIWNTSSGQCVLMLEHHSKVFSVAFSPDGAKLASASNRTIKIWDASRYECLQTLESHHIGVVYSLTFSPDGRRLVFALDDHTIKIWDAGSGEYIQLLQDSSAVFSVAFSLDGAQLASASGDSTIKIWDMSRYECLQTLEGHTQSVSSIAFSPDGARLASASWDSTVKIWDTSSDYCKQTRKRHSDSVNSMAFSPDLSRLASASMDSTVKIWDTDSGDCMQTFEGHSESVASIAFSPDGARLASGSCDNTVKIWDICSGECVATLEGHSSYVDWVAFSHDSSRLASASEDSTVRIWEVGKCVATLEGHYMGVASAAFSHDWSRLALGGDLTVRILDVGSSERQLTLEGHNKLVTSVAFSPDSTRLASASYDCTVRIWDAGSGECLQTLSIGISLYKISFDSAGLYLYTDIGAVALDTLSASNIALAKPEPQSPRYRGVALSSDGEWITYNSQNLVWLPPEYRPLCSAVSGKTIGIGIGSGRVWMCSLQVVGSEHG